MKGFKRITIDPNRRGLAEKSKPPTLARRGFGGKTLSP